MLKILTNFAMLSIKILTNAIYAHVTRNELSLRHSIGRTYRRYREYILTIPHVLYQANANL